MRGPRFQVLLMFGLMTWLLLGGTLGFQVIEGWNVLDSFYMTLITLTTVGYGEIHPLSDHGKIFNSLLILAGVTTIFASIGILTDMVIKLELADFFGGGGGGRKWCKSSPSTTLFAVRAAWAAA